MSYLPIMQEIKEALEIASVEKFQKHEPRYHLGASTIGDICRRKLFYDFRWVKQQNISGRLYRLFNRGKREEVEVLDLLARIGIIVTDVDADGEQICFSEIEGHYGGSTDGLGQLPEKWGGHKVVFECKTANSNKFKNVASLGVRSAEPKHYDQMCTYGERFGYTLGLYICVSKNDDDLWVELVELDPSVGKENNDKAFDIITATAPPPRMQENPTYYACKNSFCHYHEICFNNAPADKNCRSCKKAKPVENASWFCEKVGKNIPRKYLLKGCGYWESICN